MLKLKTHSFTLIELIAVVVIIGILAAIMVPNYNRARERAVDKQAKAILSLIRAAQRNYKMETGGYCPGTTSISDINTNLRLDLVDDGNWGYSITGSASSFTAELTRPTNKNGGYNRKWQLTTNDVNATCIPLGGSSCP